ncbi:radical SAM protein [Candidatus Thorarchaeota archaeon]|nr:MAG: radical SAM protein [Candidatus Thorarchaeota archaeon]
MSFQQYPMIHHPCFSSNRNNLWARIHLPVAQRCNVKCIFCDHNAGNSCHTGKPGYASSLMTPSEAIARTVMEMERNSNLRIIAISGPGEPLFNDETFVFLEKISSLKKDRKICLSTNGVLLEEKAAYLQQIRVDSISVSMNAIHPTTAAKVYEWALIDNDLMTGIEMGKRIISKQLNGISIATELGISLKVNTVLIPEINANEISILAKRIAKAGAILQNIVPLVPCSKTTCLIPPTFDELASARKIGGESIPQFYHCKQCRSDVVGVPGDDRVL